MSVSEAEHSKQNKTKKKERSKNKWLNNATQESGKTTNQSQIQYTARNKNQSPNWRNINK